MSSSTLIELLKGTKEKIEQLTWQQLYDQSTRSKKKKTGLNWEKTNKKTTISTR